MLELFAKIDRALLLREVSRVPSVDSVGAGSEAEDNENLAGFLLAYYGYDLLNQESVRHCLLTLFELRSLNEVARELGFPESQYVYDAALIVASAPWSADSKLPRLLQKMLEQHLDTHIGEEYFPGTRVERPPTLEEIWSDPAPPLMDYQLEVSERVYKLLEAKGARAMIQMPTGSGKTRTLMHAIVRRLCTERTMGPVLWLAHSEELCEQAITTFKRSWISSGQGTSKVYRLWSEHSPHPEQITGGLIVGGLQKIVSLRKKKAPIYKLVAESCSALVFDEAHKALAPTYRNLLNDVAASNPSMPIIGLTATPGRSALDPYENKQLAHLFHDTLISPDFGPKNPLTALRELGVLAKLKRLSIKSPSQFTLLDHERRFVDSCLICHL